MADANPVSKKKRRRPMSSCEQCRRRKVKCDQNSPCGQCLRHKSSPCTYAPAIRPIRSDGYYTRIPSTASSDVLTTDRPDGTTLSIAHSPIPRYTEPFGRPPAAQPTDTARAVEITTLDAVQALTERVNQLESLLAASTPSVSLSQTPNKAQRLKLTGSVFKNRLFGRSHFMYTVAQGHLSALNDFLRAGSQEASGILAGLERCKKLARSVKSTNLWYQPISSDLSSYLPTREVSDRLLKAYFRTSETVHRILHVPAFLKRYERLWQDRKSDGSGTTFLIQLLLVLAIGAVFDSDKDAQYELHKSAEKWVYIAHSWLTFPFTEKQTLSITGIQTYCLYFIARDGHRVGGDLAWIGTGSLLRVAILIGLHRDPSGLPGVSVYHSELRRRLWATVMELCWQASMTVGGPPLTNLSDSDCPPPLNVDDDQIGDHITTTPTEKGKSHMTQTTVQRLLLQTLPMRLRIASALNDAHTDLSYAEVLQLSSSLSELYQRQLKTLDFVESQNTSNLTLTLYQKKMLQYAIVGTLNALHLPFSIKAKLSQAYYFSRKLCLDAALSILDAALKPSTTDVTDREEWLDYQNLNTRSAGFARSVIHIAALSLNMEVIAQREEPADFLSGPQPALRDRMREAVKHFASLTLARLKAGEFNVKSYMFACSVLAQLDAIESGKSVEVKLKVSLQSALQQCLTILEDKVGMMESPISDIPSLESLQDPAYDVTSDFFNPLFWLEDMDLGMTGLDWTGI